MAMATIFCIYDNTKLRILGLSIQPKVSYYIPFMKMYKSLQQGLQLFEKVNNWLEMMEKEDLVRKVSLLYVKKRNLLAIYLFTVLIYFGQVLVIHLDSLKEGKHNLLN